jgi:hypothetical protein
MGSRESDRAHWECLQEKNDDITACFQCTQKVEVPVCKADGDCDVGYECMVLLFCWFLQNLPPENTVVSHN